jgi:hypothetical protein
MHLRLANALLILASASLAASAAESDVRLIERLYQTYAWEATDAQGKSKPHFIEEPLAELQKYLTPTLAQSLHRDRQCAKRTQQVCRLDFSPMWASQDPAAKNLRIEQGSAKSKVKVSFTNPGSGEQVEIEYELGQTPQGPRVRDIHYSSGLPLFKILRAK